MTDDSPRLRAALRYMVYGREDAFDAENVIDLLQALEKFKTIRDDGDGSAFKVDGVRGTKDLGVAGDFVGSQKVDISDRDTDVGDGRFRVSGNNGAIQPKEENQVEQDEQTVREALKFFFNPEGKVFREFMLEEIVTVVDASGRDAAQELARRVGLGNIPVPSFLRAMSPELDDQDRRMVDQIGKLVQFLSGDVDSIGNNNQRLRELVPVIREYGPQLRDFGTLLVARLTEKNISRGLNWATGQLAGAGAR
jgi:aarF domain-containing kinase